MHDTTPLVPAPRMRARRRPLPWIAVALGGLLALTALLRGTRGEAEARRSLLLREGEVLAWLARDLADTAERAVPTERAAAPESGAADAAPAWRDVLAAVEESIALQLKGAPRLPSLAQDARLAGSLANALGARRFVAYANADEYAADPWARRAAIFATLLADGCAVPAERGAWLEAAVAFASDLRSVGTLSSAVSAAALDDAAAKRLADDGPLAAADAQRLVDRLRAAQRRLPRAESVALRETHVLQATICALADLAPLNGARLRSEGEPPLALVPADDAVSRLDRLPGLLYPLLNETSDPHANADFAAFVDDFSRHLPRLAPQLPTAESIAAASTADARLARLLTLAGAQSPERTAR